MTNQNNDTDIKYIIVIGASAGGFKAVTELISRLPPDLPTAIFIVMHLARSSSPEIIRHHLEKFSSYECRIAVDEEEIQKGKIYLAPADFHLLIKKDRMKLTKGPHENRYRPSIDALFRSAAANYDSRVIGIILSGMLDDGTSGMSAIKRSGGTCLVQDPQDATYPDMPASVLKQVDVDHRVPVADMGYILDDIFTRPSKPHVSIPDDVQLEADITERMISDVDEMAKIGEHSNFTCPDCGGGLWRIKNDPIKRYRCHTGHVYTEGTLAEKQNEALEESLWVCIRMLEERRNLLMIMAGRTGSNGQTISDRDEHGRAAELHMHIERLKELLTSISKDKYPKDEGYR
ncbi:chemotaxis protein CheB [Mucilaginibacter sp. HD30]